MWAFGQIFQKVAGDEHSDVDETSRTFAEPMIAVGVNHVIKGFSQLDEFVNEPFNDLNVGVGFT